MEKTRLDLSTWENIIRNIQELEGDEFGNDVEIMWLEGEIGSDGEWVLCHGYEMFEDGFTSEKEASGRLEEILKQLNK